MMKLWELFCQNVSHRFIIICADLSCLDPRCERFSFRLFWIHLQWLWTLLAEVLNLRIAWVILIHFLFLLIRLPSLRRCGLAETVGLWFCVDSNRATSVFVLGLVCVCVYRLNRRKTSSLYYIIYGRGQRDLQLWPLPTKLHTGDQVNVPACPALGAFKTQLGGHNIFFAVVLYCHCPLWSIYIYISYINSAPV